MDQEHYNSYVEGQLNQGASINSCYQNFRSKAVKVVRIGHPVGETEMIESGSTDLYGGRTLTSKVIRRIGIPIVVRTRFNNTLEIVVPSTNELWDAVMSSSIYMSLRPMKVLFDKNGVAYDIELDDSDKKSWKEEYPALDGFKSIRDLEDEHATRVAKLFDNDLEGHKSLMSYLKKDKKDLVVTNANDSNLKDVIIFSIDADTKTLTEEFRGETISESAALRVREGFESYLKRKSLKVMDFIKDPKAIISDIRGKLCYVKIL